MPLLNLPPETLSLILEFLADEDLTTLILAQRVCKHFQASIERIVFQLPLCKKWNGPGPIGICPLLQDKFGQLFVHKRREKNMGIAKSWGTDLAFRSLPWAAGRGKGGAEVREVEMRDSPYLRPEASWRRLSVTFGAGPAVRSVDVLKALTMYGGTSMDYEQLVIPPPPPPHAFYSLKKSGVDDGTTAADASSKEEEEEAQEDGEGILTMGLLYDLLASGEGHMGYVTTGWQFLPGTRLRSYDDWQELSARERYPGRKRIAQLFVRDEESAGLLVTGHRGCVMGMPRREKQALSEEERLWVPRAIGGIPVKLLPWQGPFQE
ncbi:uncharacterized protein F4812DRAFT_315627 [Daldinia caldariorum]|uniref:uncharacterized protein n=1 Tax=Daldinia caldariorum TaxID=326644 RepID=UPI002008DB8F|nr:uncharacterized protein F4812DRAFT_315627 [Daldinia caldariorum]KAI1470135.1 hypothetical protein F4812DRAFT_315627 [Daldinia caldariorum]